MKRVEFVSDRLSYIVLRGRWRNIIVVKAGARTICLEIHKLITSIWKKEKLPAEWKESIIVPIHKKGDKTDCNNYRGISLCQPLTKFYPTSCSQG